MGSAICGGSWGMGVNMTEKGDADNYGFPTTSNPHEFFPDYECCTEKEIAAWEKAKEDWTEANL